MSECDTCMYRGSVPNSRHSCCNHPEAKRVVEDGDLIRHMMDGYVKENTVRPLLGINVVANEQGIVGNWCFWPWNFDPIWIDACTGYAGRKAEVEG